MDYPFYVNNFDRVSDHRINYPSVAKIFKQPMAFWYGERNGKPMDKIDKSLTRLFRRAEGTLPIFVIYNMPNRDMGHYSKGGADSKETYLDFITAFAKGIGDRNPIVVFEPDALPHSTHMELVDAMSRWHLMSRALTVLTENCNALVYVDIGHSNWLDPETAGKTLERVTNNKVRGFSVNVSNFRTTEESLAWAEQVAEHTRNKHFVIDTSRNGNGPYGNEWCNPPGRALGITPTTNTGHPLCDAYLWIKVPGESDGRKNNGPRAGRFWPSYAEELVANTPSLVQA
jgi:endoglucanase